MSKKKVRKRRTTERPGRAARQIEYVRSRLDQLFNVPSQTGEAPGQPSDLPRS